MGNFDVAGGDLKKMIKHAKKKPVSFGFAPGKTDEESYCGMHRKKAPMMIGKEAKEEAEGKFTFGTATVEGKLISLTCMREIPSLAKKFKRFLKSQKIMMNVQILDADGNVLESDIEDGLPDDPEMDGDVAEDETDDDEDEEAPEVAPAAPPPPGAAPAAAGTDQAALLKRLGELRTRMGTLPPDAAAKLAAPFKQVVDLVRAGDLDRAAAGADKIDAVIERLGGQVPPASPPLPPVDPQMAKLQQAAAAMRARADAVTEATTRATLLEALDRVDGMIAAREAEKALATLKKLQQILATPGADDGAAPVPPAPPPPPSGSAASVPPAAPPPQTGSPEPDLAADWERRFSELEPRVNAALSQGLIADVDELRKQWDWATGNAADGAYDKALATLPRVEALLAAAPADGQSAFDAAVPPDIQPFAKARVQWASARSTMLSEVGKLESAIVAACAGDEQLAEVVKSVTVLTRNVEQLDTRLEDAMDAIVNAEPGPARDQMKGAARKLIDEYRTVLQTDFFKEVDQASGFGSFAIAGTANATLSEIAEALA